MPACSRARSSARSSGAAGACSGSSSTTGARACSAWTTFSSEASTASASSAGVGQAALAGPDLHLRAADARGQLEYGTGGAHELRAVAQVVADLALDGGDGNRPQVAAARGLEAVDGLDEADGADLHEVVDGLASACVAARYGAHETHVLLDEARTRLLMPPRHDAQGTERDRGSWVNFRPVSPWFHRWLQGSRAPLGGMK